MRDHSYEAAHETVGVGIEPLEAQEHVIFFVATELVDAPSVSIGLIRDRQVEIARK